MKIHLRKIRTKKNHSHFINLKKNFLKVIPIMYEILWMMMSIIDDDFSRKKKNRAKNFLILRHSFFSIHLLSFSPLIHLKTEKLFRKCDIISMLVSKRRQMSATMSLFTSIYMLINVDISTIDHLKPTIYISSVVQVDEL